MVRKVICMKPMAIDEYAGRAFKRLRYKRNQFACFGDTYEENLIWDSYIHGESIVSEDILIVP